MNDSIVLDAIDRRILRVLQEDGRATYDVLAQQVGLSPSAVLRRVKRLEESGVVLGYVALLAAERIGLPLTAYLNVRLEKHTERHKRNPMDLFRAAVQTWPEVIDCAALTGEKTICCALRSTTWRTGRGLSCRPCSNTPVCRTAGPASSSTA